jgi:succinate dehydrogenase assembly factor 1
MARHSKLQLEVLGLYRSFLRVIRTKPEHSRDRFKLYIRSEFQKQATGISKRDLNAIEYLLRRGKKNLEVFKNENLTDISI